MTSPVVQFLRCKNKGRHAAFGCVTASDATVSRLVRCAGTAREKTKLVFFQLTDCRCFRLREYTKQNLLWAELHLAGCDFGDYWQPVLNFELFEFAVAKLGAKANEPLPRWVN